MSNPTCNITHVSRECNHCTNGVIIPTDLCFDTEVTVRHYDDTLESYIQLKSDDKIYVQNNYSKICEFLGQAISNKNAMWAKTQTQISEVASEHNMLCPQVNFGQRRFSTEA